MTSQVRKSKLLTLNTIFLHKYEGTKTKKKKKSIVSEVNKNRCVRTKFIEYNTINPIQYTTYYFYFSRLHDARLYFILIREKT